MVLFGIISNFPGIDIIKSSTAPPHGLRQLEQNAVITNWRHKNWNVCMKNIKNMLSSITL